MDPSRVLQLAAEGVGEEVPDSKVHHQAGSEAVGGELRVDGCAGRQSKNEGLLASLNEVLPYEQTKISSFIFSFFSKQKKMETKKLHYVQLEAWKQQQHFEMHSSLIAPRISNIFGRSRKRGKHGR